MGEILRVLINYLPRLQYSVDAIQRDPCYLDETILCPNRIMGSCGFCSCLHHFIVIECHMQNRWVLFILVWPNVVCK